MEMLFFTLIGLFIATVVFNFLSEFRIHLKAEELFNEENKDENKKFSDLESLSEEKMRYWYKAIEELKK